MRDPPPHSKPAMACAVISVTPKKKCWNYRCIVIHPCVCVCMYGYDTSGYMYSHLYCMCVWETWKITICGTAIGAGGMAWVAWAQLVLVHMPLDCQLATLGFFSTSWLHWSSGLTHTHTRLLYIQYIHTHKNKIHTTYKHTHKCNQPFQVTFLKHHSLQTMC